MRRLLRWAFNRAAVVSAVLFVGACIAMAQGRSVSYRVSLDRWRGYQLETFSGAFEFLVVWRVRPQMPMAAGLELKADRQEGGPADVLSHQSMGFGYEAGQVPAGRVAAFYVCRAQAPGWFVCGLLAVLPVTRLLLASRSRRARRRKSGGLCAACGYDLRATPLEGGALLSRCPECGTVPGKGAEGRRATA